MKLFNRKIKIDDKEFWLIIDKLHYNNVSGRDYYEYHCSLYKEVNYLFGTKKKKVYSYKTHWLDYYRYYGDIDNVIYEVINTYKKNLNDQKYISEKENCFKSKYEV